MARYAIGDIQGCFSELMALLEVMCFHPEQDQLYLVGDMVNRGPDSLGVLQWVYAHRHAVYPVLGNHDLHLLACAEKIQKVKTLDTFQAILASPECNQLMEWLRQQPLLLDLGDTLLVHAGIPPGWSLDAVKQRAALVNEMLSSPEYLPFLQQMYGNKPQMWSDALSAVEMGRLVINGLTRMRMVDEQGRLDFDYKGDLRQAPANLQAWFASPLQQVLQRRVVFGHWSALGLVMRPGVVGLDTGCIWGGQLTAVNLDTLQLYQVPALRSYQDIWE